MRARLWIRPILVAVLLVTFGGILDEASAVPAFARKYGFSCNTCHAPMPRLKEYGEEFAGNGFRLPEGQEPKRAYRDTGDDLLTLQRDLPLAVRIDAFATLETRKDAEDRSDLKTPWGLKLLSGGSVAEDVGYYFYFYMSERGEVAGVEDAYLHFNDLFGRPLDVLMGQFQVSDPMMKRELRLSFEDYQAYKVRPGGSGANLTYDRGVMVTYDTEIGLGFVGEVVNGNGKGAADEERRFDGDRDKAFAGRVTYSRAAVTLGGFAYSTKERVESGGAILGNEIEIFGPDLHLGLGRKAAISAQYLRRRDSAPELGAVDIDTDALVAELVLQPQGEDGRNAFVLLYNWVDSDLDSSDYESWTGSWSYLHRRNLRLIAEFTYDALSEDYRSVLGFVSAF